MNGYNVSIIVPTFNRACYIEECLNSLLNQTVPACEILVVDDGSEDDTAIRVAAYGDQIRYIYKENGGKPSAVNLGLSLIKGDLVWLFDDDDVALPDAIEHRVEVLKLNPDAGFVYTPHFLGADDENGRIVRGRFHNTPQYAADVFFLQLLKGCFFHLATALVRRQCYQNIGDFDSALLSGEDYDVQIRLARITRSAFCSNPTFIFRQHEGARGAKSIRYAGTKRDHIFQKYNQILGKKVRAELSLGEYLVPRQTGPLNYEAHREALLNRMCVMGSNGCIPEMFEDLQEALASMSSESPITVDELKLIAEAICTGYAYNACESMWRECMIMARNLKKIPSGNAAIRALATGFFSLAKGYPGSIQQRLSKLNKAAQLTFVSFR